MSCNAVVIVLGRYLEWLLQALRVTPLGIDLRKFKLGCLRGVGAH